MNFLHDPAIDTAIRNFKQESLDTHARTECAQFARLIDLIQAQERTRQCAAGMLIEMHGWKMKHDVPEGECTCGRNGKELIACLTLNRNYWRWLVTLMHMRRVLFYANDNRANGKRLAQFNDREMDDRLWLWNVLRTAQNVYPDISFSEVLDHCEAPDPEALITQLKERGVNFSVLYSKVYKEYMKNKNH